MTSKYKIVALFGPAGSGKDYILKTIMNTKYGQKNLQRIVSYTTRPPRENEKDNIDYHFVKNSMEFCSKTLIEYTIFKDWWYATSLDNLNSDKINIGIFNVSSIDQLINRDYLHRLDCLPIYIKASPKIRLIRQLTREDTPDCDEIIRRYTSDKNDFLNIPFQYNTIDNEQDKTGTIIKNIFELIHNKWSETDKIN